MNNDELEAKTTRWGIDRGIIQNSTNQAQMVKLMEEVGELASDIAKQRPVADSIGDCIVVLNNIAHINGLSLNTCWNQAYDEIKSRKGYLNDKGVFVKESDL